MGESLTAAQACANETLVRCRADFRLQQTLRSCQCRGQLGCKSRIEKMSYCRKKREPKRRDARLKKFIALFGRRQAENNTQWVHGSFSYSRRPPSEGSQVVPLVRTRLITDGSTVAGSFSQCASVNSMSSERLTSVCLVVLLFHTAYVPVSFYIFVLFIFLHYYSFVFFSPFVNI